MQKNQFKDLSEKKTKAWNKDKNASKNRITVYYYFFKKMFKLAQKLYERVKLILPILQSVTDYKYKTPKTNQINNGKNRLACA